VKVLAEVIPFHGIRYNTGKTPDMTAVVTPPYDVIDAAAQQIYYERHPCNVIRLEYGQQYPTDHDAANRYTRAADNYRDWLQSGILIREPEAAIYLQEQSFQINGCWFHRTGFFARVALEEYATGKIRPHEETLSKPKADRMALLATCQANFSPVFSYYEDTGLTLESDFDRIKKAPPQLDLVDDSGVVNQLWVITDPAVHQKVAATLKPRPLYIADGHHRYETALNYYHSEKDRCPGAAFILMYLVNTTDPGLVVLPTHRIVRSLPALNLALLKERLQEDFAVEKTALPAAGQVQKLLDGRRQPDHPVLMMVTTEPAAYLLTLQDHTRVKQLVPQKSEAWCSLDVAVLHVLILDRLLGLEQEALSQQENLTYTRDEAEALQAAASGQAQLSFILNPTRIEQVTAVAAAGDKMPQKSTYFYPKVLTGLVINDLTSER
jgi:uncharacterized protein (DUF1015 family)